MNKYNDKKLNIIFDENRSMFMYTGISFFGDNGSAKMYEAPVQSRDEYDETKIQLWLKHFDEVICKNDELKIKILKTYFAQIF